MRQYKWCTIIGDWMNDEDGLLNLGEHLDTSNAKVTHGLIHPTVHSKRLGCDCVTQTHRVNWKRGRGKGVA